jgi:hypothetical protein
MRVLNELEFATVCGGSTVPEPCAAARDWRSKLICEVAVSIGLESVLSKAWEGIKEFMRPEINLKGLEDLSKVDYQRGDNGDPYNPDYPSGDNGDPYNPG